MKQISLLVFITIIVIYSGCKKDSNATSDNQITNSFFDSAVQFLKTNLSKDDYSKLDLTSNKILRYQNRNIGIQIFEKESFHTKFILLGTMSGNYQGNWVDLSGLKTIRPKYQSGFITLESFDKVINRKFIVENNAVIQIIKSGDKISDSVTIDLGQKNSLSDLGSGLVRVSKPDVTAAMLPEVVIYYDVDGDGSYYSSLFWLSGGDDSYDDYYVSSDGGGGGSGSGTGTVENQKNNVAGIPTIVPPESPVLDLKQEFKCFTNSSTSTYSISVNVNEPYPNSRDIFNPISSFPVGHTFLTLEQHNSDGSMITRNVGFYPKNGVKPGASVDKSTFGEDSYTPFDVSLQVNVTGSDFNAVLNNLINQQAYNYDVNNFNCTTSAIDALNSININLPDTKSADIIFTGNDPADLGEDIRTLNLQNFSAENGNRQFIRAVSNYDDQTSPPREGTCP